MPRKRRMSDDVKEQERQFKTFLKRDLPDKVMGEMEQLKRDAFAMEGYPGGSKWQPRQKPDPGRALLVQSGDMKRSIETEQRGLDIVMISDATTPGGKWSLTQIHNEGLNPVPQRQMMPLPGEALPRKYQRRIDDYSDREMDRIFK